MKLLWQQIPSTEVTKLYWKKDDLSFNELTFLDKSPSEQRAEIWKEIKQIRKDNKQEHHKTNTQIDNNYKLLLNVIIVTFSANLLMHLVRGTIC